VVLLGINFSGRHAGLVALFLPAVALALWTFAPRYVTSKVVPLSLVFLGLYGFTVVREFARGAPWVTRHGIAGGGSGSGYAQTGSGADLCVPGQRAVADLATDGP